MVTAIDIGRWVRVAAIDRTGNPQKRFVRSSCGREGGEVIDSSMAENVRSICSPAAVEHAWNLYAHHARQVVADPKLIADRAFNEELARRYDLWRRLFLFGESCNLKRPGATTL